MRLLLSFIWTTVFLTSYVQPRYIPRGAVQDAIADKIKVPSELLLGDLGTAVNLTKRRTLVNRADFSKFINKGCNARRLMADPAGGSGF